MHSEAAERNHMQKGWWGVSARSCKSKEQVQDKIKGADQKQFLKRFNNQRAMIRHNMLYFNCEAIGFACCLKYTADSDPSVDKTMKDELRLDFLLVVLSSIIQCMQK